MIKKIGAVAGADIFTKVLSYMLLPIYLGIMPQEDFGQYSFIVAFLSPIFLIVSFSLYVPYIKSYCAEGFTKKKELTSTIFISLFLWLLVLNITFIFLKPYLLGLFSEVFKIFNFVDEKYYLVMLLINTGTILLYCYSLLLARKKPKEIIIFIISKFILITIFSLISLYINIFNNQTVVNRLIGVSIAECIFIIVFMIVFFRSSFIFKIDFFLLKKNLKIALPLVPLTMITFFTVMVDRTLIAEHHGLKVLASYGLAMVLLSPIQMIMTSVQTIWAPQLYSMPNMTKALKKSMKIMFISSVAMIIGVVLLSILIYISIIIGVINVNYKIVPTIIVLGSVGTIASSLMHLNSNMFVHLEKTTYLVFISLLVLILNLVLNQILIPSYSFYGAATAAAVANITGLSLGYLLLKNLVSKNEKINEY